MTYIKSGMNVSIAKRMLRNLGAALLLLPALGIAAGDLLLNEDDVAAKVAKTSDYQLLDARGETARQIAPFAFSNKYEKGMRVKNGLVFVVADNDETALEIAQSIPAENERSVFAVKGGADGWKRAQAKVAGLSMPEHFIIPKNTCEATVTVMKMKSNAAIKSGKTATETKKK